MAPILYTPTCTGLPICLSETHPLPLSKEMADHDRRRKGLKKLRYGGRKGLHAHQRNHPHHHQDGSVSQEIRGEEAAAGDLAFLPLLLLDLSSISFSAKAA